MRALCSATLFLLAVPAIAAADEFQVDHSKSSLTFAGNHAGTDFVGKFMDWSAEIEFDAANVEESEFSAEFVLKSARTGNRQYDGTLPTADWFNTRKTPVGEYASTLVTHVEGNTYRADGTLSLRGVEVPVSFEFLLDDPEGSTVRATASFDVMRLDWGLGVASDPASEWVTNEISIEIDIVATRE